ncbi:MAG: hypothetical protein LZF86_110358 [Nitrospira sp.]|nr:MAG: hypothetical protein LZF86_110358 [Nitrospira sp.]
MVEVEVAAAVAETEVEAGAGAEVEAGTGVGMGAEGERHAAAGNPGKTTSCTLSLLISTCTVWGRMAKPSRLSPPRKVTTTSFEPAMAPIMAWRKTSSPRES